MLNILHAFVLVKITIFAIIIFLSLVYSLLILIIPRFHHRSHILTFNLSVAFMCCCIYWLIYCVSWDYYNKELMNEEPCALQIYAQIMCTCQLAFAFIVISINRFFPIVYHTKLFFKTKKWLLVCIISQWVAGFIVPIPLIFGQNPQCTQPQWISIYRVVMIVAFPSLISFSTNAVIFIHIRSSFRRVQCSSQIRQTNTKEVSQVKISRHDIHLLRHMIYTFCVFIGGWGPIFILMAIDFRVEVAPIVYIILAVWGEASLVSIIINLFRYNHKLRQYLKSKIMRSN